MDMRKLLESMDKFAGQAVGQKPGDQVRGTEKAKTGGKQHPFKGRLVGAAESVLPELDRTSKERNVHREISEAWQQFQADLLVEEQLLNSQFDIIEEMIESIAEQNGVDADLIWEDFDDCDDEELLAEAEAWQKSSGKNKNGGLNKKGVASYRRSHPGSKLQTAVTTKPSKLKKGSKASKRRKSFCARMKGMKKHRTGAKTKRDPNSRINKALRKWNCESAVPTGAAVNEIKTRLDPKCWTGKHKEGTKIKGGVRVNNCVPNEGVAEGWKDAVVGGAMALGALGAHAQQDLGNGFTLTTVPFAGQTVKAVLDTQNNTYIVSNNGMVRTPAPYIAINAKGVASGVQKLGPESSAAMEKAGLLKGSMDEDMAEDLTPTAQTTMAQTTAGGANKPQDAAKLQQQQALQQKNLGVLKTAGVDVDPAKTGPALQKAETGAPMSTADQAAISKMAPALGKILQGPQGQQLANLVKSAGAMK